MSWRSYEDYVAFKRMHEAAVEAALSLPVREESSTTPEYELVDFKPEEGKVRLLERMPLLGGATEPVFYSEEVTERAICTPQQNSWNQLNAAEVNRKAELARQVAARANALNEQSKSAASVNEVIIAHDNFKFATDGFYTCSPTVDACLAARFALQAAQNTALAALSRATDLMIANAEREHGKLKELSARVFYERLTFETTPTGGEGIIAIERAHSNFVAQENVIRSFVFGIWGTNDNKQKIAQFWQNVDRTHTEEANYSAITELDRLRNEYVELSRPAPRPAEFTQSASTAHFTFQQLNTGSYSWALIKDILLVKLEELYSLMSQSKLPIQLNSVYRNPRRADGLSRHQYGDAVDLQVYDNNNDGSRADDWETLKELVRQTAPAYIEPMAQSGEGHVHADWRSFREERIFC